ncbi:MAG TPA: S8 family peptidase [Vicinamibacterales bacterium]|nr:S8 family peptidase [Vicinamibacterales bacterium]
MAQRPAASFPVIVVFRGNAPLSNHRADFRADERAAADPDAWGYLDRDVVGSVMALERRHGFRADHVYSAALRGFAARLSSRQIDALEQDPDIALVEPDGTMFVAAQTVPWGVARIDGGQSVSNVNAYIIDTGIDTEHADLNVVGHVKFAGGPNSDCHGHGTHVAGTVAARNNTIDVLGVAAGASLTGVKVLGCGGTGSTSGVIKGVDWVTSNAVEPAIANMSLGGGVSTALDNAVKASANSGVFYSVAAGNSGADACTSSPARAGTHNGVMTTAATDSNDNEASWSNFGSCVDIWAPGVSILSTRNKGGTTTMSGTSMAAPHVGGAGAVYLSLNPGMGPADVEAALKGSAVATGTTSKNGAPIKLVCVGSCLP